MINSLEQQYLKEINLEKMFMHNYDDTIKFAKSDNKKAESVVQNVNEEGIRNKASDSE